MGERPCCSSKCTQHPPLLGRVNIETADVWKPMVLNLNVPIIQFLTVLTCCFASQVFRFFCFVAVALSSASAARVLAWSPEWVCQGDREGMGWKRKDWMRWRWDVMMVMTRTRILKIVIIRTTFIMHLPLIRIASLNRVTSCGLLRVLHFFHFEGKKLSKTEMVSGKVVFRFIWFLFDGKGGKNEKHEGGKG